MKMFWWVSGNTPVRMLMMSANTSSSQAIGKPITITVPGAGGSKTLTITGKTSLSSASHILQQANAQVIILLWHHVVIDYCSLKKAIQYQYAS